jgi:hypothetical protein
LLLSTSQDDNEINFMKEAGKVGLSVLFDIGGRATGDMQAVAQAELFSNVVLDVVATKINYNRSSW